MVFSTEDCTFVEARESVWS